MRRAAVFSFLVLTGHAALGAQIPASADSMLHRLFGSREFASQGFGPARWVDSGNGYTTVERSPTLPGGVDVVRYATATGDRSVLVRAEQMVPTGATEPLRFDDYSWSADGSKLLLFTNTARVWRQNTRGDYWVLDRTAGTLRKLGGPDAPPSTLMYAKFSPQGDRVAYVRQGDLYVERLADQGITRLTSGADSLHVNGMTDWVYEEEFDLRDAFRWSPDGTRIAFWHFDMTGVGTFLLINNTDSLYPFVIPIQYPKAGTTNSAVTVGVVPATGGAPVWIDVGGDPRDTYLPRMQWVDAGHLLVQQMNRLQNADRLMLADASSGTVQPVMTERDSAWVDAPPLDLTFVDHARGFLWLSERDGWRHLYRVGLDGHATLLTPGPFDVQGVAGVDPVGGWAYYDASPDNATQNYLFRVRLDGSGHEERITPSSTPGMHGYNVAPGAHWAFHNYSTIDTPPVLDLVSLPAHQPVRSFVTNDTLKARVAALGARPAEFFQVTLHDGATLDGWMLRPRNFDSTRTYPLLMYVYGEPAAQTVVDAWSGATGLWFHMLADQGYLVASVDNRGTPAPKGRAWRKVVYGKIGILSSAEQADAVRVLEQQRHYIDPSRIAIWGWSGGGSSTLQAMFRYPDVYQVGMSVAPVPDERLYDTIYQERYMGLPETNGAAYDSASAINQVAGLRGHLLLMHGSGDDNVHFQGSQRLLNRLIALDKPIDFMEYPNRSHCICEGAGTTLDVYTTLTRYLLGHLAAGGKGAQAGSSER